MPPVFSFELADPTFAMDDMVLQRRTSPCEAACPAGNPIQKMQSLIAANHFEEALEYLRARNPFPGTTGRICSHPCETGCNRAQYDEALNIKGIERAAADWADMTRVRKFKKMEATGKSIAVIGGGPAGLTAAYYSALLGHQVTVFEAGPNLGGMIRMAVPGFRLSKDVVDREIGLVLEAGIKTHLNTRVGVDISFQEIRKAHDAVLIAAGTWDERPLDIPGGERALKAVDFLCKVNLGQIKKAGPSVAVIGGGGVAFDCAFAAKRLGAQDVFMFCLEDSEAMCAPLEDLLQAREEGITVFNKCVSSKILQNDNKVVGLEYCEISGFSFDQERNAHIQTAQDTKGSLKADMVIAAIGLRPKLDFLKNSGIQTEPDGTIAVDPQTMRVSLPGVFASGDVVSGPSLMANAVGMGRKAALAMNRYLTGTLEDDKIVIGKDFDIHPERISGQAQPHVVEFDEIFNLEYYEKAPRQTSGDSAHGVYPQPGLARAAAVSEASRCFQCGRCRQCGQCVEDCPGLILTMAETGPVIEHPDECWHCGNCRISCPDSAISFDFPIYMLV